MLGILKIKNKRGPKNPNRKGRGKTWEKGLERHSFPFSTTNSNKIQTNFCLPP
jgi:hypothetical protein